ncbi:MAG: hypothetical protein Roseis2KO_35320 [Roseivirga sp.]
MSSLRKYLLITVSLLSISTLAVGQQLKTESLSDNRLWIDPNLQSGSGSQSVVVWFNTQFLGEQDSFLKRAAEFEGQKRSELREKVISTLKSTSNQSFSEVKSQLNELKKAGHLDDLVQHWIINGFSCSVDSEGLEVLGKLKGVARIFKKRPVFLPSNPDVGPEYLSTLSKSTFAMNKVESYPWNIEQIRAPEVWRDYDITGKGTLNVVHDMGFKLDIPPLAETLYVNRNEIPGNGIDDDKNGFIDDYHGYNFDAGNASVNNPRMRGTMIHGNSCAAMISGTFATNTTQAIGIAPESKWAPVVGAGHIEQAVEWAIEQGADTYSMSFSQPNLGEYRTHWRKIMEQGTFCGVVFISGAGNFAAGNNAAPIPVQMRIPEGIPNAVLGVAGVGRDGKRPAFSSQGPVEWATNDYSEGSVKKPDFATLNFRISCVDLEGNLSNQASGNSFAGPHLAGIVSLMLSANPELLPWEVKEILKKTAKDIGPPGFDYQSGHGFVNAYDAVTEVLKENK